MRATEGRATLLGAEIGAPGYMDVRRRTGVVPQSPGMYTDVSCLEYLELARRLHRGGDVAAAVSMFGLRPYLQTRMSQLSGGFQRRIVLAAALLSRPEVLILDEPTVGLDPVAAHEVHEYLRRAMSGRTTLLCTHNLAEAEALCDEVVILREGSVLVHEPLASLRGRSRPQLRLRAGQGPEALIAALRAAGHDGVAGAEAGAVLTPIEDAAAEAPGILRALIGAGLDVYECRPLEASLQELFLEIVRWG